MFSCFAFSPWKEEKTEDHFRGIKWLVWSRLPLSFVCVFVFLSLDRLPRQLHLRQPWHFEARLQPGRPFSSVVRYAVNAEKLKKKRLRKRRRVSFCWSVAVCCLYVRETSLSGWRNDATVMTGEGDTGDVFSNMRRGSPSRWFLDAPRLARKAKRRSSNSASLLLCLCLCL